MRYPDSRVFRRANTNAWQGSSLRSQTQARNTRSTAGTAPSVCRSVCARTIEHTSRRLTEDESSCPLSPGSYLLPRIELKAGCSCMAGSTTVCGMTTEYCGRWRSVARAWRAARRLATHDLAGSAATEDSVRYLAGTSLSSPDSTIPAAGSAVTELHPGTNVARHLAPSVYFTREAASVRRGLPRVARLARCRAGRGPDTVARASREVAPGLFEERGDEPGHPEHERRVLTLLDRLGH